MNSYQMQSLPENLESLSKQENKIRTQSILQINSEPNLKEHLDIVYSSLNIIFDVVTVYEKKDDDELTIQALGARLFNTIVSALNLLLTGYYQNSFILQRDILEIGFLLDFFTIDRAAISDWAKSSHSQRQKKYAPVVVRKTLDKRDGFTEKKREQIYKAMCEYAAHPTYKGMKLIAPKGLVNIGPFLEPKYLKNSLEELAMRVPFFTVVFLHHFEDLPPGFLKEKVSLLDKLKEWGEKFLNLDLSRIDMATLKKWTGML